MMTLNPLSRGIYKNIDMFEDIQPKEEQVILSVFKDKTIIFWKQNFIEMKISDI